MHRGYIKLYRKLTEWEWYSDINVTRVFIHCLLRANHKDNKWQGKLIKKGSFITSREKLATETTLTVMQVRTALNKLKSTNEITIKTTNQNTIITVNNWDIFQDDNQQINQQITNNQPTDNQQITTNNNDKNDKNEKKLISDRFQNEFIAHYENCYKKIIGANNCFLLQMHRDKLNELAETLGKEKYFEAVKTVLQRLKTLNFQSIGFKPNTTWLLKDDNFIKVLEGTFEQNETTNISPYTRG